MTTKPDLIVRSQELATDYHLFVHGQPGAQEGPLILVMDGDDQFGPCVEAARLLRSHEKIPALTLVGVGYGGSYRAPANRRGRDYTPSRLQDEPGETGGADRFHQFIRGELIDRLVQHIGAAPAELGIAGHSLGSLFGIYALTQPDPLFDKFLISSPSIWWDDRSIMVGVKAAASKPLPRPIAAFLSVGQADTESMTGDVALLEQEWRARPRPNLKFTVERFEGLDHYNVLPTSFGRGLEWLYGAKQ